MAAVPGGSTRLPNIEFIGIDVIEIHGLLLLDRILQVTNGFRARDVNWKGVRIIEAKNPAGERDLSVYLTPLQRSGGI